VERYNISLICRHAEKHCSSFKDIEAIYANKNESETLIVLSSIDRYGIPPDKPACLQLKKEVYWVSNYFLNLEISQNIRITTSMIPIIAVYAPALKMSPTNSQEVRVVDKASATINK
jgi:hypothetical protein